MSKKPRWNRIPSVLTESQFNEFVLPHIPTQKAGPKPVVPRYKIFNYVLYLMHTGCQWYNLPIDKKDDGKPEIHHTRIFKIFKGWADSKCMALFGRVRVILRLLNF